MTVSGIEHPARHGSPGVPTILSLAFPFAVVGEGAVGGAEVVLSHLESALPSLGFASVVVARQESQPAGVLYATPVAAGEITEDLRAAAEAAHQANLDRALAEHPVALIHMHGLDFHRYRVPPHLPVVATLHLPPDWYPETIWHLPPNYHLVCVSETQRSACPAFARDRLEVIGNGVPLPDPRNLRPQGRYALMLSRICPEKNLHMGFEAARLAGVPALLAGEVFPYRDHLQYFAQEIEPRLTAPGTDHVERRRNGAVPLDGALLPQARFPARPDARFLGPVTGAAKTRLLSRAACVLLPSLAPETSSMVAMEAMAAGVPVVAVASGAVPEIVEAGRTGLLVPPGENLANDLAAALQEVMSLDRSLCRATAETRFCLDRMLGAYAALYRRLTLALPVRFAPAHTGLAVAGPPPTRPGVPGEPIATSLLSGLGALETIAPAWETLWGIDPSATPFQHPAWLLPWARQFGPDGLVQAIALHNADNRLVGFLPLFTLLEPANSSQSQTPMRKLLLLGAGTTDYLGGVFCPADRARLAAAALRFAAAIQPPPSRIDFPQLREDSPLLAAAAPPGWEQTGAEPCALVPLSRPLPAKLATNLRRYRRMAEPVGPLALALATTREQALADFDLLAQLHTQRWQAREEEGVLHDSRVLAHHRQAIPALLAAGLLRSFRLVQEAETIAVLYALADPPQRAGRRLYLYLIGIDVRWKGISPGSLLLQEVWNYGRREGFTGLDLLRGGEAYKSLWGAILTPTRSLHRVSQLGGAALAIPRDLT